MRLCIFFILIALLFCNRSHSQIDSLQVISGLPTKEAYQILVDKKGFVWVAHELGVSRYDGISFTNFSHPQQLGLSLFNLFEDEQGRIWCHNLNSQIFFIENGQMQLLKDYNDAEEKNYPCITGIKNEVIVNAMKGIYVQNTTKQKGYYIRKTQDGKNIGATISFCAIGQQMVILGQDKWFIYNPGVGVNQLQVNSQQPIFASSLQLIATSDRDTVYATEKYRGILYKFLFKNNALTLLSTRQMAGIINGGGLVADGKFWVHSTEVSTTNDNSETIKGHNLSSMAIDKEGNYWFSSLKKGLLFKLKNTSFGIVKPKYINKDDFIKCIATQNNYVLEGTAKGVLILKNKNTLDQYKTILLPQMRGSIENIFNLDSNRFLITSFYNFYVYDAVKEKVTPYFAQNSVNNISLFNANYVFVASYQTLYIQNTNHFNSWAMADWPKLGLLLKIPPNKQDTSLSFKQRIKSVCFDNLHKTLYVNLKEGLYAINKLGTKKLLFDDRPINANSLIYANGKVFAGTLVNGLLVITDTSITDFTTKKGLASNTILKMRLCNNRLWLLSSGTVQTFDINKEKLVTNLSLPPLFGSFVYDVAEINNDAYLTTADGLYKVSLNNYFSNHKPLNYLLSVLINQTDTLPIISNSALNDGAKSLTFTLAALWYTNPHNIYFKYRLLGANNDAWQVAPPSQRTFNFTGLSAGNYQFQAVAINGLGVSANQPISFAFSIKKPWWQQWWLYILGLATLVGIIYVITQQRINTIKKRNEMLVEKIQLQGQVRNSMLMAIKSQMNPHFIFNALNTIQSFIYSNNKTKASGYLGKFSNLIRIVLDTSNKKTISLTEELEMLQLYIDLEEMRFENTLFVSINVDESLDKDAIFIPPMLIQPFVENAIKHGLLHKINDRKLSISFKSSTNKKSLEIEIDDNGIGREKSAALQMEKNTDHNSFAMQANQKRIDILNQLTSNKMLLEIVDKKNNDGMAMGTTVRLAIPNEVLENNFN